MSLETVLFNNPVSFVITDDNRFATQGVMLQSQRSNMLYLVKDDHMALLLSKNLKLKDSKIIQKDIDFEDIKKYNFSTYEVFKEYLINKKSKYNIFDQIFIVINDTKNIDLFLVIKLIGQLKKDKADISSVCYILRNSSIEASYDLKMKKTNTFTQNNELDVDITYSEHTYKKNDKSMNYDIIEDVKMDVDNNMLVILNTTKDVQHMYYHMVKNLDSSKFFIVSIYVSENNTLNYYDRKDPEKTMIYLISSDITMRISLPGIQYIFDGFGYSGSGNLGKSFYNSKDRANKYINYFSADLEHPTEDSDQGYHIKRYTTKDFFENTYAYDVPDIRQHFFYYNFLLLIDNNYDPVMVFKKFIDMNMIKNIYNVLHNMKILNMNKILIDYNFLFSLDLFLRPSLLIMKAIKSGLPIYPFIVMACIINYSENGFYKEKHSYPGMLKSYLDTWIKYSKEKQTISIEKEDLFVWAEQNNLNKYVFYNIVNEVKRICDIVSNGGHNLELGLFNTDNLIQAAMPHLLEAYGGYVFEEIEKHSHHYSNGKNISKIANNESKYPKNVISFKSTKPSYDKRKSSSMDLIVFYLGFNTK